ALGLGALSLSLFGARVVYGLVGPRAAFLAMCVVTLSGTFAAVVSNRRATAVFALLGGLLTPVLLTAAEADERDLLAYLVLLDLVALAIARFKSWPGLIRLRWLGSAALFAASLSRDPDAPHPLSRLLLVSALFVLFLAAPLLRRATRPRRYDDIDVPLAVANAAGYFFIVHATLAAWHPHAIGA